MTRLPMALLALTAGCIAGARMGPASPSVDFSCDFADLKRVPVRP